MLGKLIPNGGGPPILLLQPRLVLGRQASCDITISMTYVSGRHCELELVDGFWRVRDLGSTNGTQVNGVACREEWIQPNDVLTLGQARFRLEYAPPDRPAPRADSTSTGESVPVSEAPARTTGAAPSSLASSGLGELVPCGGGAPILLRKSELVVGRQPGCDIWLPHGFISGRHCRLTYIDGLWLVEDLGSRNGIRVNGTRCTAQVLRPGAVLCIAVLRYRINYRSAEPAARDDGDVDFSQKLLDKAGLTNWKPEE